MDQYIEHQDPNQSREIPEVVLETNQDRRMRCHPDGSGSTTSFL